MNEEQKIQQIRELAERQSKEVLDKFGLAAAIAFGDIAQAVEAAGYMVDDAAGFNRTVARHIIELEDKIKEMGE